MMLAPPRTEVEFAAARLELGPGVYPLFALHLAQRINVEELAKMLGSRAEDVSKVELSWRLEDGGRLYVFGYGTVVFFNTRPEDRPAVLKELDPYVVGDRKPEITDDFTVEVRPGTEERVEFERVVVATPTPKKLKLVARILAQSTSLERFEMRADDLLERAAEITETLAVEGKIPRQTKDLLRFVGVGLNTRRKIVSQLSLIDPPEEIWDDPSLDMLYDALRANLDLQVRFRALEYKLELIEEAVEVVTDLHDSRRGYILELIVIALIALEVIFAFIHH